MNITGRLTSDAKVSTTSKGKEVVNFQIAVNDGYRSKDGNWVDNTSFIDCAYWRTAKVALWLKMGLFVELSGQISARAWKAKDGTPKAGLNFTTSSIKPAWGTATENSKTNSENGNVQGSNKQESVKTVTEEVNDDLPF